MQHRATVDLGTVFSVRGIGERVECDDVSNRGAEKVDWMNERGEG